MMCFLFFLRFFQETLAALWLHAIGNADFPPLGALHEQWSVRLRPPVKVEVFSRERQIFFVRLPYQKIVVEQNAIQ